MLFAMKNAQMTIYIMDSEKGYMLTKAGDFCNLFTFGMGQNDTVVYKQFAAAKKRLEKVSKKAFPNAGIKVITKFGDGKLTEELTAWFPWNKIH
jgi:hypothetical protein